MRQTILGSGGAIGVELAKALTKYTSSIKLVSRNPTAVNPGDELFPADITKKGEVDRAVKGSSVVYLTVGFPYSIKAWKKLWPDLIQATLDACINHGAKLVFFDNIYMYDPDYLEGMSESTPIRPVSKKGKIRALISERILQEAQSGRLSALIARSADYYGPGIKKTSILTETVFDNLAKGKKAFWIGRTDKMHSFTYTKDAGQATAILGNTPDAYNQVWHLPTAPEPPTGKEWIYTIAGEMKVSPRYMAFPKPMVQIMGIFVPFMKELAEMMYQYDRNYVFDSSKFERKFEFTPTLYSQGIKEIVSLDYSHSFKK
jgi:nucleoside-diphosphate-sugar epimerase